MDEVAIRYEKYNPDFENIMSMISKAKRELSYEANIRVIDLYWKIGEYVYNKNEKEGWGRSTVN